MESRVQKWGNSLAVRIPKPFAAEVGLQKDDEVDVQVNEGTLVIRPLRRQPYKLADLLDDVKRSNLHREADWGLPMGKEAR